MKVLSAAILAVTLLSVTAAYAMPSHHGHRVCHWHHHHHICHWVR